MNRPLTTTSNVYYLPTRAAAVEPIARQPKRPTLAKRVARAWSRLRFMVAEIASVVRRGGRNMFVDEDSLALARTAEMMERLRPRYAAPAPVIDFEIARRRLRKAAEA